MKEYYISDGENKRGAFSLKDLKHETVLPDTLIWKEGWEDWKTAKEAALIESAIDLIINDVPPSIPEPPIQAVPTRPKAKLKKKKSLLKTAKTLWKAADGDIDDLGDLLEQKARNIEGKGKNKYEEQSEQTGWRGFLASRQNAQGAVFHMLFRRQLGEKFFNRAIFFAVMLTLVSLKIFLDFSAYKKWWNGEMIRKELGNRMVEMVEAPFPFCVMDAFIILILIFGIYHLMEQKSRKSKGIVVDKNFRGISRFTALGERLKPEAPEFGATLFVEPLIAMVASFLLFWTHSFFFGIIAIGAASKFWYENYLLYQESLAKTPQGAATDAPVMSANLSSGAVGFTSLAGNVEQGQQEQAQKASEKPSFTTMVYYAIGERLDKYLAENQDKISSSPLLQKIQQARIYFNKLNVNQRKSANFFISSAVVFVIAFIWSFFEGTSRGQWLAIIAVPFYIVVIWSAYLAFSQIKILDKLINEGMSWVYLLGMGLIPVPIKNILTGFVKLILFLTLAVKFYYVGVAYLIYRIVIPFLDLKTLPSFEKA